MTERLWKVSELATLWGVHPATITRMIKARRLKGFKPTGGTWRIAQAEVNRLTSGEVLDAKE